MKYIFLLFIVAILQPALAQNHHNYTHQDTLRGSLTQERTWWDLLHYNLSVKVNIDQKSIEGTNVVKFKVLSESTKMQIDLQEPLTIKSVNFHGKKLNWITDGNAHFIQFDNPLTINSIDSITINYSGNPRAAKHAPWDGGFSWTKDKNGRPFVATSNQGIGASLWWPCKDHGYDEPNEGVSMQVSVPKGLTAVCNGRLTSIEKGKKEDTFKWRVVNPINNYGVNINIGDYVLIQDTLNGEKGTLDLNYYVLSYNEEKARTHFQQAKKMLRAFEYWFGPYPFYEDSYKLVEVPYLGMEHQSSITYGNQYQNGYLGRDRGNTGYMDKFDYIIIHESGHEWFANNITCKDNADMWIHESFTTYSEALFVEYYFGKDAGQHYIQKQRGEIANKKPLISDYDVNADPGLDIYYKGSNMLNCLRTINDNDVKWLDLLRSLNSTYYHSTVSSSEVESYISDFLNLDLHVFFDQYLRDARLPALKIDQIDTQTLNFTWSNCIEGFDIPVRIKINGKTIQLDKFKNKNSRYVHEENITSVELDSNYYVQYLFDKSLKHITIK